MTTIRPLLLLFSVAIYAAADTNTRHSNILKEAVESAAAKQIWDAERVRVTRIEGARYRYSPWYEFRVRIGEWERRIGYFEEKGDWIGLKGGGEGEEGFEGVLEEVRAKAVIGEVRLEGPFELSLGGNEGKIDLRLLPLNTSIAGLGRVLVRDGIAVEITGAQEISLFRPSSNCPSSSSVSNKERDVFWSQQPSTCAPLLPVHVSGSPSIVAYLSHNPNSSIEPDVLSKTTVELKPKKCFPEYRDKRGACPFSSLGSRIAVLEKLLRVFSINRTSEDQNAIFSVLEAKMKTATEVRFRMELEMEVTARDLQKRSVPEWRTKPGIERALFDVVARVGLGRLNRLVVKNVKSVDIVDSSSWSSLSLNRSFDELRSILVPPRLLTLDVKW
ncbi:hypothetical protein Droror1_Dr00001542 [Drosera rotundifolia]